MEVLRTNPKNSLTASRGASRSARERGSRQLRFEGLESRRLLAAQPGVSLSGPAEVFLGEPFQLTASFDNLDASDAGYGPFLDLYIPVNGNDGVGGVDADGISVTSDAEYLGVPITTTILNFPDDGGGTGTVDHPYAVDSMGVPLPVTGIAGDQLVTIQLPFGSFTPSQPAAAVTIDLLMSADADLQQSLDIQARAGFQYGSDALENPASDPSLVSDVASDATTWTPSLSVEPILIELSKTYLGPENETATGPNFPRQYRIDVDVASGQQIDNLDITDLLPNNVVLDSVDLITPAGTTTTLPTTPANAPDNELVVTIPAVTGGPGGSDASVVFTFHVPFRDADNQTVLSPTTGDDGTSPNHAAAVGDWTPSDPDDPSGVDNATASSPGPEHTLTPKSIATQKSVALRTDPLANGYSPGDTVEFTIDFQVSDFFGFDNIVLTDVLADGHRFDALYTPTMSVTEHGTTVSGSFDADNFTVIDHFTGGSPEVGPIDGSQEIIFRLSDELVDQGADSRLLGGLLPDMGTGGGDPSVGGFNAGATTGTIVFRAVVQEDFTDDFPSTDPSVDEGDTLDNSISITGEVLSHTDLTATGESEVDGSSASYSIVGGTFSKSIYALNDTTMLPDPLSLSPGDTITYRLELDLPTSDVEDLVIEDYLPLPIFDAAEIGSFIDTIDNAIPPAGSAKFGPTETFRALYGSPPALTSDATANSLTFTYGDFDAVSAPASKIDILFTVTASDDPFADGLFLTNQARRNQETTNATGFSDDAIVQILLGEPALSITKGVVATDNPNAEFSPATVGPVTFTPPGSAGYRGLATIHSTNLTAAPIDSDLDDLDAGDLVTFAILVENTGGSRAGAFDLQLRDTLPTGFTIPAGGLNLSVTDGTGASFMTSDIGSGLFDVAGGIEIVDPGPTPDTGDGTDAGALDQFDPTNGRNILVITYDLELVSTVEPNSQITNTATLFRYAGAEGGPDFTAEDISDDASASTAPLAVAKSLDGSSEPSTTGANVAIGEIITYTSTITVPEGVTNTLLWTDIPDSGLSVVDLLGVTASPGLATSQGTFADVQANAVLAANGDSLSLDFGTVTNSDTDNGSPETIAIEYRAVVLNSGGNGRNTNLDNLATATWTGGADAASAPQVTIVEPTLNVVKSISPASGQASDTFTVTLDITHTNPSNADAFDVTITDDLPTGFSFVGGLSNTDGLVPSTLGEAAGVVTATYNTFADGQTSQIQFDVRLDADVEPGSTIGNNAVATWTSLPGDVTTAQSTDSRSTERTGDSGDPGGICQRLHGHRQRFDRRDHADDRQDGAHHEPAPHDGDQRGDWRNRHLSGRAHDSAGDPRDVSAAGHTRRRVVDRRRRQRHCNGGPDHEHRHVRRRGDHCGGRGQRRLGDLRLRNADQQRHRQQRGRDDHDRVPSGRLERPLP